MTRLITQRPVVKRRTRPTPTEAEILMLIAQMEGQEIVRPKPIRRRKRSYEQYAKKIMDDPLIFNA